ncbi:MAG: glycine zipper family protein [Deltaproteobacteria bacterium]|nr:glycine zipper family protein [Deltaproteobacteria bacterium]
MAEIATLVASYPLVVLSVPFALVLLYWLFVVLGALDIDLFHSADAAAAGAKGALEGAAKGVLEGAGKGVFEGAAKGVLEGAGKGVFEGAAKGVMEGAGKAVLEGAGKGVLEGAAKGALATSGEAAVAAGASGSGEAAIGALAALRAVPATVSLSVWVALSWLVCAVGARLLAPLARGGPAWWLLGAGILVGSLLVAAAPTTWVIRPLARLFLTRQGKRHRDLVGQTCVVSTGSVSDRFGQATLEDGSLSLLLQVRHEAHSPLRKGDRALIVTWDPERQAFTVEPLEALLGRAAEASEAEDEEDEAGDGEKRVRR